MTASTPPPSAPGDAGASVADDYAALRERAALDPSPPAAILLVPAADVPAFAARSLGGDRPPVEGRIARTALRRADGRVVALALALRRPSGDLLLDVASRVDDGVPPGAVDASAGVTRLRLRGPAAPAVLDAAGASAAAGLPVGAAREDLAPAGVSAVVLRDRPDSFRLLVRVERAADLQAGLVTAGGGGVRVAAAPALEIVRVEDGELDLARDLGGPADPGEVGLGGSASSLVRLEHEGVHPLAGALVQAGGVTVGRTRAAVRSPLRGGRPVALATLAADARRPGIPLEVVAGRHRVRAAVLAGPLDGR